MSKSRTNPKVDAYLREAPRWRKEVEALRKIILDAPVAEELKWGKPCYTFQGGNIVVLLPLKNYCALLFPKGVLLKDPEGILIKAGENTQAARQLRFTSVREIAEREAVLRAYLLEAVEVERKGVEVKYKETSEYAVPDELRDKWKAAPALKAAFEALTPGRQRGYLLHFSEAKQATTRKARIEKCVPKILQGKGWNER